MDTGAADRSLGMRRIDTYMCIAQATKPKAAKGITQERPLSIATTNAMASNSDATAKPETAPHCRNRWLRRLLSHRRRM